MCQNDPTFYCPLPSVGTCLSLPLLHYDYHHCSVTAFNDAHLRICSQDVPTRIVSKSKLFHLFLEATNAPNIALKVLVTYFGAEVKLNWCPTELQRIPGDAVMQSPEQFPSISPIHVMLASARKLIGWFQNFGSAHS